MSRKIIYKNNSTSQDRSVLIDDADMSQQNGYGRFGDLTPDGKKQLNFRLFTKIAVVILAFLFGYFTCHLMSPLSENHHETCIGGMANLNNSKNTNHNNETYLNITKSMIENVTKFTSSSTEIGFYSTSENTRNIITERTTTHLPSTEQPRVATTTTTFTSTSTLNTTQETRVEIESCLKDVTNRFEEINSTVTDKCFKGPIGRKSTIIFHPNSDSSLFDCLISQTEECDTRFHITKEMDIRYYNLKHIRYNFVMGDYGNLYEGRPLSCSLDDIKDSPFKKYIKNFESIDISQIILIGMPACDVLDSEKKWERIQFTSVAKNLIGCLADEGILSPDYTIQFDEKCKDYLHSHFHVAFRNRLEFFNNNNEYYDDYDRLPVY